MSWNFTFSNGWKSCRESAIGRGKTSVVHRNRTIRFISANYSHTDTHTHMNTIAGCFRIFHFLKHFLLLPAPIQVRKCHVKGKFSHLRSTHLARGRIKSRRILCLWNILCAVLWRAGSISSLFHRSLSEISKVWFDCS